MGRGGGWTHETRRQNWPRASAHYLFSPAAPDKPLQLFEPLFPQLPKRKWWLVALPSTVDETRQCMWKPSVSGHNGAQKRWRVSAQHNCLTSRLSPFVKENQRGQLFLKIPILSAIPPIPHHKLAAPKDGCKLPEFKCPPFYLRKQIQSQEKLSFPVEDAGLVCVCFH